MKKKHQYCSLVLDDSCVEFYWEKEADKIVFAGKHEVFITSFFERDPFHQSNLRRTVFINTAHFVYLKLTRVVKHFLIDLYEKQMKETASVDVFPSCFSDILARLLIKGKIRTVRLHFVWFWTKSRRIISILFECSEFSIYNFPFTVHVGQKNSDEWTANNSIHWRISKKTKGERSVKSLRSVRW